MKTRQLINAIIAITILCITSMIGYYMANHKSPSSNSIEYKVNDKPEYHSCDWEDCEHVGKKIDQYAFVPTWGHEPYTDGWCVEFTHFMNPEMTYSECEEYVFSGVE